MEQQQASAEMVNALAALAESNNQLVAENQRIRQQLDLATADVRIHNRRARQAGETALNMGGPGS